MSRLEKNKENWPERITGTAKLKRVLMSRNTPIWNGDVLTVVMYGEWLLAGFKINQ